jgi:outer membrane protein OmpA-like peptidoglycan-associated protein
MVSVSAASAQTGHFSSESSIDWVQNTFSSRVMFDIAKAGIPFPSGRGTAATQIKTQLPRLLKDALLSLTVDSMSQLSDWIVDERVRTDSLTQIISESRQTPGILMMDGKNIAVNHTMNLSAISSPLVQHQVPYVPNTPVEQTPTRPYTGIVIDARGALLVQGEFGSDRAEPCFFPRIWDDTMELFYERNMADPRQVQETGIVQYDYSPDDERYQKRVGVRPLRITARKIFGVYRTDPVIARTDALKILASAENRKLLEAGRIVILLDEDKLIHPVSLPDKNQEYYDQFRRITNELAENKIGSSTEQDEKPVFPIQDSPRGIQISIQDIKFGPNAAALLPSETERLNLIANSLREFIETGYTFMVEGHAADLNLPEGELTLSIERARLIVSELVSRGLPESMFDYRGYGSAHPIADNSTPEGRAQNRRVEILIMPKSTYIQQIWE